MSSAPPSKPHCDLSSFRAHLAYFSAEDGSFDELIALRNDVRRISKRADLFREGDPWDELYILRKGWAFSYRYASNSSRQIFSFFLPGDPINIASLRMDRAPISVQSLTDVAVCVFSRTELDAYVHDNIRRTHHLEHYWLQTALTLKDSVMDLGRRTSTQRIARLILSFEQRLRERNLARNGIMDFPLRYRHIGDTLGLTPVHVNRVISLLRERGIIELRHRTLTILRMGELVAMAR